MFIIRSRTPLPAIPLVLRRCVFYTDLYDRRRPSVCLPHTVLWIIYCRLISVRDDCMPLYLGEKIAPYSGHFCFNRPSQGVQTRTAGLLSSQN